MKEHSWYIKMVKNRERGILMIRVNLDKYIKKHNLNINQLSKETGISRKALTSLATYNEADEPPVSIQYNTIDVLCSFFKIGVSELISYEYKQENFAILPIAFNLGNDKNISIFLLAYEYSINGKESTFFMPITTSLDTISEPEVVKNTLPKYLKHKVDSSLYEQEFLTPRFLKFSFEVVLNKYYSRIEKYLKNTPYFDFIGKEEIKMLSDNEIASLMKSFSKSFLSELTARFFEENIFEHKNIDTQVTVRWNFGYYSHLNSDSFRFEYSVHGNTIFSLDGDNIMDPLEGVVIHSEEIESATYPNIFKL